MKKEQGKLFFTKQIIHVFHEVFAFKDTRSNSGNCETKSYHLYLACASTNIAIVLPDFQQFRASRAVNRFIFFCQSSKGAFK